MLRECPKMWGDIRQHYSKDAYRVDCSEAAKSCCSFQPIKCQSDHHIETSQLICRAKQLTGLCMLATLAFNELIKLIGNRSVISFCNKRSISKCYSYKNPTTIWSFELSRVFGSFVEQCKTQNVNKSFPNILWKLSPQSRYHSTLETQFSLHLETLIFNQ